MSIKKIRTHKDLDVWNKSMDFAEKVYTLTATLPMEERYGLLSQMRRSAVSIPSNIAEGAARNSHKEFIKFLYIAQGSLAEIETQLLLAKRLYLINKSAVFDDMKSIRKMLSGLIRFLKVNKE